MFIELPTSGSPSRRFVQTSSIREVTSSADGSGTYQVGVHSLDYGSLVIATGLTQGEADNLAEDIATAIGLDWRL